jgi:hypothetical protein
LPKTLCLTHIFALCKFKKCQLPEEGIKWRTKEEEAAARNEERTELDSDLHHIPLEENVLIAPERFIQAVSCAKLFCFSLFCFVGFAIIPTTPICVVTCCAFMLKRKQNLSN